MHTSDKTGSEQNCDLDRTTVVKRFAEIALQLDVAIERANAVGWRCYQSEVSRFAARARDSDRERRRSGPRVCVKPTPEVHMLQYLGQCAESVRDDLIISNVRLHVRLYIDQRNRLDEIDPEELASLGLESGCDAGRGLR